MTDATRPALSPREAALVDLLARSAPGVWWDRYSLEFWLYDGLCHRSAIYVLVQKVRRKMGRDYIETAPCSWERQALFRLRPDILPLT